MIVDRINKALHGLLFVEWVFNQRIMYVNDYAITVIKLVEHTFKIQRVHTELVTEIYLQKLLIRYARNTFTKSGISAKHFQQNTSNLSYTNFILTRSGLEFITAGAQDVNGLTTEKTAYYGLFWS